jgi:hypothetical protein
MRARHLGPAIAVGLLALTASTTNAQTGTRIMIGPFIGLNYTTVSGRDVSNPEYRTGLAAGGQLDAHFEGGVFFRTGALYSQRGANFTSSGNDVAFRESYIEVPLLLGYAVSSPGSTIRPFIMGGGQVGFKTSCELAARDATPNVSYKCEDLGGDFASNDFSAVAGAGVMFPVASGRMSFDARYALGLQKIQKASDSKHRGFTFGVAYMIPFGG